jgi:hypothetical protein
MARYPTTKFERAVDSALAAENRPWEGPLTKEQKAEIDRDVRLLHEKLKSEGLDCPCAVCVAQERAGRAR